MTNLNTHTVGMLQDIELLKVGGNYYGPAISFANVTLGTDNALGRHWIELMGQQVLLMDLAGIYSRAVQTEVNSAVYHAG